MGSSRLGNGRFGSREARPLFGWEVLRQHLDLWRQRALVQQEASEALDELVMFLRLEFSETQENKRKIKGLQELRLDPAGSRYLKNTQAQIELLESAKNCLQELIMKTRDSYRNYRYCIRNTKPL